MREWIQDDGYSGCKTARYGEIAVVICPPEGTEGWGYQAFDESDEEAVMYGVRCDEGHGFSSEQEVIEYAEERWGRDGIIGELLNAGVTGSMKNRFLRKTSSLAPRKKRLKVWKSSILQSWLARISRDASGNGESAIRAMKLHILRTGVPLSLGAGQ